VIFLGRDGYSDVNKEALDACLFVLLPLAKELWLEKGGEPDFSVLRENAEKKWGKVFSTKYRYFDGCIGMFRRWNIFAILSHRYSDSIELVNVYKLKTINPTFEIQDEYFNVHYLRGEAGALDWLRQSFYCISEATVAYGAKSLTEENYSVVPKDSDDDS